MSGDSIFLRTVEGDSMHRVILFLFLLAGMISAQYTTASLGGAVRDSTGAVVADARVTARNTETGFAQTVTSDATGSFLFSRLPVGGYELRVEKPGFSAYVQSGIQLTVDRMATQNVTLQVGAVSEQVTVQAEAELIQTLTAAAGQLVHQKRIVELPLNCLRPEQLGYLASSTLDLAR